MGDQNLETIQAPGQTASTAVLFGGPVSGLYATLGLFTTQTEELRLDVDGNYPQMTASGVVPISALQRIHWIAQLVSTAPNRFTGGIWFKDPAVSGFAYTAVTIEATPSFIPVLRFAKVTFSGMGLPDRVRIFKFRSSSFHKVQFEFDAEAGIVPETTTLTCAHPNHPSTIPCETLGIEEVYRRAGFDVRRSGDSIVPIAESGGDTVWSDAEMHDAMQTYWSRFANIPQWSLWTFFARQHESGTGLGGIMFDDIGTNHRQGTALFYDSFISEAPVGDPNPGAFINRMRFWTAVHEMGHAFNLAHSWQKSIGVPGRRLTAHARVALAMPLTKAGRKLYIAESASAVPTSAGVAGSKFQTVGSDIDQALRHLRPAVLENCAESAETLGHVDYKYYVDYLSNAVAKAGNVPQAAAMQDLLYETLSARNVKASVLKDIKDRRNLYGTGRAKA